MATEHMKELAQTLRDTASELEETAIKDQSVAENVLDFERGVMTLPELVREAKEVLGV